MCFFPMKQSRIIGRADQKTGRRPITEDCMPQMIQVIHLKHSEIFSSASTLKPSISSIIAVEKLLHHHRPLLTGIWPSFVSKQFFNVKLHISRKVNCSGKGVIFKFGAMDGPRATFIEKMPTFNFLKAFYLANISCINNILCAWRRHLISLALLKSARKIVIDEHCKFYFNTLTKIMLTI